jgi:predicted aconitase
VLNAPDVAGWPKSRPSIELRLDELASSWEELSSPGEDCADLISLGNPRFSFSEINRLASLCTGQQKHPDVAVIVACGRATPDKATEAGLVVESERFGGQFVTDICWCTLRRSNCLPPM